MSPLPNPAALERVVRETLPEPRLIARNLSVRVEERQATVFLFRPLFSEEEPAWREASERVRERTGFELLLSVHAGTPAAKNPRDSEGKLEVNLAYQAVRNAFAGEPHAPYRVGKKVSRKPGNSFSTRTFRAQAKAITSVTGKPSRA